MSAQTAEQVPHPRDVLGFTPGDDYRIADFSQMQQYFRQLDRASDRVQLTSAGTSTEGNDILVAVISSPQNLARVDHYKDIARRLAYARGVSDEEARRLASQGKAIVWIDNGLHAAETAHAQHAFLLAHRVATEETEEMREIRDNAILVLLPCVNPEGLDLVADWYRKTVGTPHQDSPMPWLFNTYVGYGNNRDFFMQTQVETQLINRLLYFEWLPQIMYNQHQGFYPTRIFVPPFPDPFNPNIDPGVIRGIELIGAAMQHRFEQEGKEGVISRYGFSSWYNGSLRTTTYFHNMIGILTETTHDSPSPFYYDPAAFPDEFANGWSTREPSTNYSRPWKGDTLHFRDALDYMLTGSLGVLDAAAKHREDLLYGVYQMGARQIELGRTEPPVAYVIPPAQHDPPVAAKFIEILMKGGIQVHRADASFTADGRDFPAGSYVVLLAQPFRPFAKDLLEPQRYPDIRRYPGGPPVPPYDNAGWTLSQQMGIRTFSIARPIDADLAELEEYPRVRGDVHGEARFGYALDPRRNNTFIAVNRLLGDGHQLFRATDSLSLAGASYPPGAFVVTQRDGLAATLEPLAAELGLDVRGVNARPAGELIELRQPKIGLWFVLDRHEFPYSSVFNAGIRAGDLRSRFDVIVIPSQDLSDIIGGYRLGRRQFGVVHQNLPPSEYQGGIESDGVAALQDFVESGGTLVLVDRAADLAITGFGLPVRNALENLPQESFFGPGSIVGVTSNTTHPIAYGMTEDGAGYFRKSRAYEFDATVGRIQSVVRYASRDLLKSGSGWLLGEEHLAGRAAVLDIPLGNGRVIMLGFPAYFRAQPHGTFKLLFNSLFYGEPPR
jgi:hypothetical protein